MLAARGDHRGEVGAYGFDAGAAQSIVAAEFQYDDLRLMPIKRCAEVSFATHGCFTGHAGVDHHIIGMFAHEACAQEIDPALVTRQAVARGDAVAEY